MASDSTSVSITMRDSNDVKTSKTFANLQSETGVAIETSLAALTNSYVLLTNAVTKSAVMTDRKALNLDLG